MRGMSKKYKQPTVIQYIIVGCFQEVLNNSAYVNKFKLEYSKSLLRIDGKNLLSCR